MIFDNTIKPIQLHNLPALVTFTPKPKTDIDQVLDEVRANARDIEDIVVLFKTKKGEWRSVSNQGDVAGNLLFIERAKIRLLQDDAPPAIGTA